MIKNRKGIQKLIALTLCLSVIMATTDAVTVAQAETITPVTENSSVDTQTATNNLTIQSSEAEAIEQAPTLDTSIMYITEGATKTLEISNLKQDAIVSYNVMNTNIAGVIENGRIVAFTAGETSISINIQQAANTYNLLLKLHVIKSTDSGMTLDQIDVKLGLGETWKPGIELVGLAYQGQVTYTSDDSQVAYVDSTGIITAKSVGTTVVKAAQYNGNCIIYNITVDQEPSVITLPSNVRTIKTGGNYLLNPVITTGYSNSKLKFISSDNSIATVDENGVINAVKEGSALITITAYNGISTVVTIRVADEIGSFQMEYITGESVSLAKNQSRTLYYSVSPANLSSYAEKYIKWSSDNEKVAVVDNNGKITAINKGTAMITLSTLDGSVKDIIIKITVTDRKKGTSYSQKKLSIINTSTSKYTYKTMVTDLKELSKNYGDCINVSVLSQSYDKRNIYQVVLGNPNAKKKVMVQASLHGREYMTALLTMKQIEFYCKNYYSGRYDGEYFSELFDKVAFYIVPMANPDGVTISQYGSSGINNKTLRKKVISICKKYGKGKKSYYTKWKSNARGVNLNRNFDAYWKILKGSGVSNENKGKQPASEIEAKTLVDLFQKIKPCATVSYHATGSILYWDFGRKGSLQKKNKKLANITKAATSYKLVKGFSKYHAAGFSDWVSIKKKTCAITIEIGKKACPLKIKEFASIWSKNRMMYLIYAKQFD